MVKAKEPFDESFYSGEWTFVIFYSFLFCAEPVLLKIKTVCRITINLHTF